MSPPTAERLEHPWLDRLRGKFLVLEGPDGSGKSTQFRRLASALQGAGLTLCEVREPGGTRIGERIREVLLDHAHADMSVVCEMLLYMASRAQLVAQRILPALKRGDVVLADRFVSSTLAYQGHAGGIPVADIHAIARIATGGLSPDLVLIFDVDDVVAARRLSPLLDRMESKGAEFHRKVRAGYHLQARENPRTHAIVDASKPEDDVHQDVMSALSRRFADASPTPETRR